MVRHRERLGEPLRLVVDRARPDRVDVAEVGLRLRVHERIAVDLAGRREQEPGVVRPREIERAPGADRADVERLERHREVFGRAGRAREVQHTVDRARRPESRRRRRRRPARSRSGRARCATFSRRLVEKLSTATTSSPRSSSASHRCEPTKPPPPVTTIRLIGGRLRCTRTRARRIAAGIEQVPGIDDRRVGASTRAPARSRASATLPTR